MLYEYPRREGEGLPWFRLHQIKLRIDRLIQKRCILSIPQDVVILIHTGYIRTWLPARDAFIRQSKLHCSAIIQSEVTGMYIGTSLYSA